MFTRVPTESRCCTEQPTIQKKCSVRSFVGLVNYYHYFLPNLSNLLQPSNQLLEKDRRWKWTPECEQAFLKAKESIESEQLLACYDPQRPSKLKLKQKKPKVKTEKKILRQSRKL